MIRIAYIKINGARDYRLNIGLTLGPDSDGLRWALIDLATGRGCLPPYGLTSQTCVWRQYHDLWSISIHSGPHNIEGFEELSLNVVHNGVKNDVPRFLLFLFVGQTTFVLTEKFRKFWWDTLKPPYNSRHTRSEKTITRKIEHWTEKVGSPKWSSVRNHLFLQ